MVNGLSFLIGIVTGIISGFGIGGGSLLVLYMTAILGVSQYTAGGINLLYFIGCAPAALIGHFRQRLIELHTALWCMIGGIATAIPTSLLAGDMDTDLLRRLFGVVLIYVAIREWRSGKGK